MNGSLTGQLVDSSFFPAAGRCVLETIYNRFHEIKGILPIERTKFGQLVRSTDADRLGFQVDVGWVTAAGYDFEVVLDSLPHPVQSVHLNDVAASDSGRYESR